MKEKVIVEYLDSLDSRVAVLNYDEEEIGSVIEVCSMYDANNSYNIVGELRDGKLRFFDSDEDYEDDVYSDDIDEPLDDED